MTGDAGALHCPNCGGPAAPGDAGCKYCQAVLATVSCPSCFALMFEEGIYCPKCGTRRSRAAGGERHAPCPACRAVMREIQIGDITLLECDFELHGPPELSEWMRGLGRRLAAGI